MYILPEKFKATKSKVLAAARSKQVFGSKLTMSKDILEVKASSQTTSKISRGR
jgi:hypothetical protein